MSQYERYALNANPFASETHDYPLSGREGLIRDLQRAFIDVLKSPGSHFYMLFGRYGDGKTRILFELGRLLLSPKFTDDQKVICTQLPVKTLPPKPPTKYFAQYLLPQILKAIGLEMCKNLRKELNEKAKSQSKDPSSLLSNFDLNFRNAFLHLIGSEERVAWNWFLGESQSRGSLNRIEVDVNLNTDDKARSALLQFLGLLWLLGYKALIVLADEFEYITFRKDRAIEFLETYRALYDEVVEKMSVSKNLASFIVTFAGTPDAWDYLTRMREAGSEPFIQRLPQENRFRLEPLNARECRIFIEKRLEKHRTKKIEEPLLPFEKDYPDFVCDKTGGRPRGIRAFSRVVIDDALNLGKKNVSSEMAEGILLDRGYIVRPVPTEIEAREIPRVRGRRPLRVERRIVSE